MTGVLTSLRRCCRYSRKMSELTMTLSQACVMPKAEAHSPCDLSGLAINQSAMAWWRRRTFWSWTADMARGPGGCWGKGNTHGRNVKGSGGLEVGGLLPVEYPTILPAPPRVLPR